MRDTSIPRAELPTLKDLLSTINRNLAGIQVLVASESVRAKNKALLALGVSEQSLEQLAQNGQLKDYSILIKNLQRYALWHKHLLKGSSMAPSINQFDIHQLSFMGGVEIVLEGYCVTEEEDDDYHSFTQYYNSRIKNLLILAAFKGNYTYYSNLLRISPDLSFNESSLVHNAVLSGAHSLRASQYWEEKSSRIFSNSLKGLMAYVAITAAVITAATLVIFPALAWIAGAGAIFGMVVAGLLVGVPLLVLPGILIGKVLKLYLPAHANKISALEHAAFSGDLNLMKEHKKSIWNAPQTVLTAAVLSGNTAAVDLALSWGLQLNDSASSLAEETGSESMIAHVKSLLAKKQEAVALPCSPSGAFVSPPSVASNSASLWGENRIATAPPVEATLDQAQVAGAAARLCS